MTGMMRISHRCLLTVLMFFPLAGCGKSGPAVYPVTGKVTYNGEPITTGTVTYIPVAAGSSAMGNIKEDGTYTLTTFVEGDGAVPGDHQIMVTALHYPSPDALPVPLLPDTFSSGNSGVTRKVEPIEKNVLDLDLTGPAMKKVKPVIMP